MITGTNRHRSAKQPSQGRCRRCNGFLILESSMDFYGRFQLRCVNCGASVSFRAPTSQAGDVTRYLHSNRYPSPRMLTVTHHRLRQRPRRHQK